MPETQSSTPPPYWDENNRNPKTGRFPPAWATGNHPLETSETVDSLVKKSSTQRPTNLTKSNIKKSPTSAPSSKQGRITSMPFSPDLIQKQNDRSVYLNGVSVQGGHQTNQTPTAISIRASRIRAHVLVRLCIILRVFALFGELW